jgi:hypothetical protein
MRSTFAIVAAGLGVLLAQAAPAAAQFINPYGNMGRSPQQAPYANSNPLSPYLDLTRGGNPAANYYLGVLPEIDRRNFQGAVLQAWPGLESNAGAAVQQPPLGPEIPVLPQTGHLSAFGAYGSYYNYPTQQRAFYPLNPNQARTLPR